MLGLRIGKALKLSALGCGFLLAGSVLAGEGGGFSIRLSGVLGQSQPEGTAPLRSFGASGVIQSSASTLFLSCADAIFKATKGADGRWSAEEAFRLPAVARALAFDGASVYVLCSDESLLRFNPLSPQEPRSALLRLDFKPKSFAVAPLGAESLGFGKLGKAFFLKDGAVYAWLPGSSKAVQALKLPRPEKGDWDALGFDAVTGDLLVSVGYPGGTVRRFSPSGETLNSIWPLKASASFISSLPEGAWLGHGLFGFLPAPKASGLLLRPNEGFVKGSWSYAAYGVAKLPDGTLCVASEQGVLLLPAEESGRKPSRIGGLETASLMAASPDGELLLYAGARFIRLASDGGPDSPLLCNSHEPWRMANGYSGKCLALAWDRGVYMALDASSKAVWSFDPQRAGWSETPWNRLTPEGALTKPRLLAAGDALFRVLDEGGLLEFDRLEPSKAPRRLELPSGMDASSVKALCSSGDKALFLASGKTLFALERRGAGALETIWSLRLDSSISSLASSQECLAALRRSEGRIELFAPGSGALLASCGPETVPGGFDPTTAALSWPWLFVYDDFGKRVLRFKIERLRQ